MSVRAVSVTLSLQTEHLCPTRDMLRAGISLWPLAIGSTDLAHVTHPQPGLGGLQEGEGWVMLNQHLCAMQSIWALGY